MDQHGPSSRNVVPQNIPEGPKKPNDSIRYLRSVNNIIPRVGEEILLGIVMESSSEVEYEGPLSVEDITLLIGIAVVDFGFADDYIGDLEFNLYNRRDIFLLKGWRAFLQELQVCAGLLVPGPSVPKRLILVLQVVSGVNWQQFLLSVSWELVTEILTEAITGFSMVAPCKR